MSDRTAVTLALVWLGVAVICAIAVMLHAAWMDVVHAKKLDFEDDIFPRLLGFGFWPVVVVFVAVVGIGWGVGGAIFHWGPRALVRAYVRRRERVALREAEAKKMADKRRYVVEEGPHR